MKDRLERFGLLAGGLAGILWVGSVFLLEGAGNPADPSGGAEIAEFYKDERTTILIAATLHGLGGFLFLWFVAALRGHLGALAAPSWLTAATVIGGTAGGTLMLGMMAGQSTGATTDAELLTPARRSSSGGSPTASSSEPRSLSRCSSERSRSWPCGASSCRAGSAGSGSSSRCCC